MKFKPLLLLAFIMLFSQAQALTLEKSASELLAPDKSQDQLIDYLKHKLRKEASLEAGSAFFSKTKLKDGKITEEDVQQQAAIVVSEEMIGKVKRFFKDDNIYIEIKMRYTFDDKLIEKSLKELIASEKAFDELNKSLEDREKEVEELKDYIKKLEETKDKPLPKKPSKKDTNLLKAAKELEEEGIAREYYADGTLKAQVPVSFGLMEGKLYTYSKNGNLISEIPFKKGVKHGSAKIYFNSGTIAQKIGYKKGYFHGARRWYNEEGEQIMKVKYFYNLPISGRCSSKRKLTKRELKNLKDDIMPTCFQNVTLQLKNNELIYLDNR